MTDGAQPPDPTRILDEHTVSETLRVYGKPRELQQMSKKPHVGRPLDQTVFVLRRAAARTARPARAVIVEISPLVRELAVTSEVGARVSEW
ncbi:MAG: hypothetical protein JWM45_1149 [Pseudonocardiales bacterium]|nr:hypothetical protein [Pseudonocardiales bacterium]